MYANCVDSRMEVEQAKIGTAVPAVRDISDLENRRIYQVIPFVNEEEEKELLRQMPHCRTKRWGDAVVDLMSRSGGKENGIRACVRQSVSPRRKPLPLEMPTTIWKCCSWPASVWLWAMPCRRCVPVPIWSQTPWKMTASPCTPKIKTDWINYKTRNAFPQERLLVFQKGQCSMMKEKTQTLVTDQLYNLAAGFLYALSICYFAKGADFAPGGLSGLALLGNYLWGFPIGITTLVLNVPLILLGFRFVGRAFLGKTVISMLWCTFFQDVVFADQPGYGGDPLLAALFAGITWGGALALLYMRGSSSGGTDFLTMSIKVLRPHLSVGVVTGAIDLVVILLGWPVFGSVDAVLYGLVTTAVTSLVIDKIMYGSNAGKMLTIITTKGQEIADEISRQCERGSTMVKAVGTYTGTERQMLLCVCARPQVYRIRMAAYRIDPAAWSW
mgnify:FL=1